MASQTVVTYFGENENVFDYLFHLRILYTWHITYQWPAYKMLK